VNAAANHLQQHPYVVDAVSFEYLEEIHVFTLANVLQRPIIVLGEPFTYGLDGESIEQNNFVGIYLPLLCPPTSCYRMPVVIVFMFDHFQPLLGRARSSLQADESMEIDAVPLVTVDLEPLRIHFLLPDEQGSVANNILQQYLHTVEVEFCNGADKQMVLCARLDNRDEDEHIRRMIGLSETTGHTSSHTGTSPLMTRALQYHGHRASGLPSQAMTTRVAAVPGKYQPCHHHRRRHCRCHYIVYYAPAPRVGH